VRENPWLERRVICYAHQGGAREAPSSTLSAIRLAIEHGATAIELDVHATRDGHLVVCHDPTLDRTTNVSGEIVKHTLEDLLQLDNSYWFVPGEDVQRDREPSDYPLRGRAPADHSYGIATLAEVLDLTPGTALNLDIKRTAPEVPGYERLLADLIREHERTDDVIVASFIDGATDVFKEYAPEIATSAGTAAVGDFYRAVHSGEQLPETVSRHVALQVPARCRHGMKIFSSWTRRSCQQRTVTGWLCIHGRSTNAPRWSGSVTWGSTASSRTYRPCSQTSWTNGASPGAGNAPRGRAAVRPQPRPQFGFLPWFAFFFLRSFRFVVRFDTVPESVAGALHARIRVYGVVAA
jgi:glycerophosphoryl diester phosphodiesterase